jgi:hypothetical protein
LEAFIMKAMRILAVLAIVALVAAPVATAYAGTDKAAAPAGKTMQKVVTVVSVDPDAKTLTYKDTSAGSPSTPGAPGGSATSSGNEKTVKVTGQAINKLTQVRPGQQITVTCTTNDMGEIDAISDLKFEAASGSTATPPPPSH